MTTGYETPAPASQPNVTSAASLSLPTASRETTLNSPRILSMPDSCQSSKDLSQLLKQMGLEAQFRGEVQAQAFNGSLVRVLVKIHELKGVCEQEGAATRKMLDRMDAHVRGLTKKLDDLARDLDELKQPQQQQQQQQQQSTGSR